MDFAEDTCVLNVVRDICGKEARPLLRQVFQEGFTGLVAPTYTCDLPSFCAEALGEVNTYAGL